MRTLNPTSRPAPAATILSAVQLTPWPFAESMVSLGHDTVCIRANGSMSGPGPGYVTSVDHDDPDNPNRNYDVIGLLELPRGDRYVFVTNVENLNEFARISGQMLWS